MMLKLVAVLVLLVYCASVSESAGNYTIGFEKFGGSVTSKPLNPTYRPVQIPKTFRPPLQPISPYNPNPTYRPVQTPKTLRPPFQTIPPYNPNPTYRPVQTPNTFRPPHQPNPTYRPVSTSKTTQRPTTKRTTPKPTTSPKPVSPPLWNIWTSKYLPIQTSKSLSGKIPPNTFKSDATLLGLYTIMRNAVDITLSQTGQARPVKKPLHDSYPYYYAVYHYNRDSEKVSNKISISLELVGWCDAGTSDRTCVPGTYAMCLLDWTIICVTYTTATFPCYFNASLQCATGRSPCDTQACNSVEVQTPCISTVVVKSPRTFGAGITQNLGPDPYEKIAPAPIELCATTLLELKKLESPLGAIVGFVSELGSMHIDFIKNFNTSQYADTVTELPRIS